MGNSLFGDDQINVIILE